MLVKLPKTSESLLDLGKPAVARYGNGAEWYAGEVRDVWQGNLGGNTRKNPRVGTVIVRA